MNIVLFCHSLISDWNHGNAHFLRGIVTELIVRGHDVRVYEAANAWSVQNLMRECGKLPLAEFEREYPRLRIQRYAPEALDLNRVLDATELVIVHEWNEPELVAAVGRHRIRTGRYRLLFHDTHHRAVSDRAAIARMDLSGYDAVLAFGEAVRERYLAQGFAQRVFTWHEAADIRVFYPRKYAGKLRDLVWVGNWGDDERTQELDEFLFRPVSELGLSASVFGVRYPDAALRHLADHGLEYMGFAPNYQVPRIFSCFRATLHVPRAPYVRALPGIPTIRVFEALACGIPLISAPWQDVEGLFREGDFLHATSGEDMKRKLRSVLRDPELARELATRGRETILRRHTCAQRVDELFHILGELGVDEHARVQVA